MAETFAPFGVAEGGVRVAIAGLFVDVPGAPSRPGRRSSSARSALSPGAEGSLGFFFFAYVLPTVIVFAALMSILYYLGIMQMIVRGVAFVVRRALGTSGPESLSVSANIFVGQTEAPLVIKPYIKNLTRSRADGRHDGRHGDDRRRRAGELRRVPGRALRGRRRASPSRPGSSSSPSSSWARA